MSIDCWAEWKGCFELCSVVGLFTVYGWTRCHAFLGVDIVMEWHGIW